MDFSFNRMRPFEHSSILRDGFFANEAMRAGYVRQGLLSSHRFEETLSSTEALQWDTEREKIRAQLIAEDVVRRQLEDEIRREIAIEREVIFRRQSRMMETMASVAPEVTPESHFEASLWRDNGTMNAMASSVPEVGALSRFSLAPPPLPELASAIDRFRPESGFIGERFPAARQLNTTLVGIKRKVPPTPFTAAGSAASSERELSWLGIARKKSQTSQRAWSCNICNVRCTSRESLSGHCLGKKHKAKLEESKIKKVDVSVGEFDVKTPRGNAAKNVVKKSKLDGREGAVDEIDLKAPRRNAIKVVGKETKLKKQEQTFSKNDVDSPQRNPAKVVDVSSNALLNKNLKHRTGNEKLLKSNADDRALKKLKTEDLKTEGRKKSNLPFLCERCGIRCNSVHDLGAHLKGKKHAEKVLELEKPGGANRSNAVRATAESATAMEGGSGCRERGGSS
ncbi:hypothetical protein EJ110_NYTH14620 [Nymphaea thermarum]|nr:hypothetical protein EJ110_NYTH14620 [Nymphaea thermarum]